MGKTAGISGLAVAMAAVGLYLVFSGIKNVPILEGAQSLLKGKVPEGKAAKVTPISFGGGGGGGSVTTGGGVGTAPAGSMNARILAEAMKHKGKPYVWGAIGPNTFDCSGLVVYVLRHTGYPKLKRLITTGFLVWGGAVTIPRGQVQPGDLACWQGHIGIFVSKTQMIHAPKTGDVVKIGAVDGVSTRGILTCRRVKDPSPSTPAMVA